MLDVLAKARAAGELPDVVFKVSGYTGHADPASIRILERLGAGSFNPVGDLSRPMLAAIRAAVRIPLDVWAIAFESFGGMNRLWEAGEIAAVASPCYFKVEPGDAEGNTYTAWADPGVPRPTGAAEGPPTRRSAAPARREYCSGRRAIASSPSARREPALVHPSAQSRTPSDRNTILDPSPARSSARDIGSDLMEQVLRSEKLKLSAAVYSDPELDGLARARGAWDPGQPRGDRLAALPAGAAGDRV